MTKSIYRFCKDLTDGDASMSELLGGKGAHLAQMSKMGLPIPPGFTIIATLCNQYYEDKSSQFFSKIKQELLESIAFIERVTDKKFGSTTNPLLFSVRSGAKISMPGMMDTILNLGINDEIAESIAKITKNPRFAYDTYRRFIEMYGAVVLEIPHYIFEEKYNEQKNQNNIKLDSQIPDSVLLEIIDSYKQIIKNKTGRELETDPYKQLIAAIESVFKSWMSDRAITYRKINNIESNLGTAVNVQSMVFGNKNEKSATGVVFTRSPSDGTSGIFGEFLVNAQGEDVVAGIRTPYPITKDALSKGLSMEEQMPTLYQELLSLCCELENHYGDMQDIEFTIDDEKLYLLQTRSGKRSAEAAIKIAVDMVSEKKLTKEEALLRIKPDSLNQLLHTRIDYDSELEIIATGLPASPGAAQGMVVFSPHDAEIYAHHHNVILVRNDTSPEDIQGMHISKAIVTARGGMTSHAAVVARGMGRPCVCGVQNIVINEKEQFFTTKTGHTIKQGDIITIDGGSGKIIIGDVNLVKPKLSSEFNTILKWADDIRKIGVRANAETIKDTETALQYGAEAIGLCRSEHMFFDNDKIPFVREMIIAPGDAERKNAIDKLLPLQMNDFKDLFRVLKGKSINIRLLDPPLHEFLPILDKDKDNLAKSLNISRDMIDRRLYELKELNPMLGHRGCRLGISHPEIYSMQVEAILTAREAIFKETKQDVDLELMIPLVSDEKELLWIKKLIQQKITELEKKYDTKFAIKLGTMIELPRAALIANKISPHVDYFSFGTNDLTQTTYGISRDDLGSFLPDYINNNIFTHDPFVRIDEDGVGELVSIAIARGKSNNSKLKLGVCGEHAGDPLSIAFFTKIGVDYISCSPFRVPIARVAAAQSQINMKNSK